MGTRGRNPGLPGRCRMTARRAREGSRASRLGFSGPGELIDTLAREETRLRAYPTRAGSPSEPCVDHSPIWPTGMGSNGKGALECCYCGHYQARDGESGYGPGYGDGRCAHWRVDLPVVQEHRVGVDFTPREDYARDNRTTMQYHGQTVLVSVQRRMTWFGIELAPGILYCFPYNYPPGVRELMKLAQPDSEGTGGDEDLGGAGDDAGANGG
jgi:hypothetical protein